MSYGFNANSETQRLRAQNTKLQKENAELRANLNLDKYQQQCEENAHEIYRALEKDNREMKTTIERQSSKIEKLEAAVRELKEKTAAAKDLERQLKNCRKELEECKKENVSASEKISRLTEEKETLERDLDQANKTIKKLEKQVEALGGEVEKLHAQKDVDFHNSGSPSSKKQNRKPIPNGRTKTEKKPGGQPGHQHQPRTIGTPGGGTCVVVGDDDPLWNDPQYRFDGYSIKHVVTPVTTLYDQMYFVPTFVNIKTGAHKNAYFPEDLKDEINPSPEYKAMLLLLTMYDNVGVQKAQDLLRTLTGGELVPSAGFISNLPVEFAVKSEKDRAHAFEKLLGVHAMHVDGTTIKVGGRQYNVTICISGAYILYFFRPRKGYAGVKDTPIEQTTAILIHDHYAETCIIPKKIPEAPCFQRALFYSG